MDLSWISDTISRVSGLLHPVQKGTHGLLIIPAILVFVLIVPVRGVDIREGEFEGRSCFYIRTESATWVYDRAGGGFSRLIDRDGRDWIAFSKEPLETFPASAGSGYRGLPNLIFTGPDKGAGHPGFNHCISDKQGEDTIRTITRSGKWAWDWSFTEDFATFTMQEADLNQPWWFLFEGPIAGTFDPSQKYWGTSQGGPHVDTPDINEQGFGNWQWAYFGDRSLCRVLMLAQEKPDRLPDTLWFLGSANKGSIDSEDGMVVFGFGRGPGTEPQLVGSGQKFIVSLRETARVGLPDHSRLAALAQTLIDGEPANGQLEQGINFWYGSKQQFGSPGRAQRWINVLGNILSPGNVVEANFSVDAGPRRKLSLGTDLHRLALGGDFNIELGWDELGPGKHTVEVEVRYLQGRTLNEGVEVEVVPPRDWPLPYSLDFSNAESLQELVQIVDGHWKLEPRGVRTVTPWYDRVIAIGDQMWTDYEALIRLTLHGFTPPQKGPPTFNVTHFGVALRWRGHIPDGRQPSRQWFPLGAQGELLLRDPLETSRWRVLRNGGSYWETSYSEERREVPLEEPFWVRARVENVETGTSLYRFKHWKEDEPEPKHWIVEALEERDFASGSICIVPHNSDVTIHEIEVRALAPSSN